MKFECDWPCAIPSGLTQEPCRCKAHTISILSWKWYISRTISKTAQNIKYNRLLLREVTPIKISIKMTIDLENILDRICPLRTLEMAFQSTKISKFSGGACPQTPLVVGPFTARLIHRWLKNKKTRFYILKKFDSLSVLTWYPLNEKITKVR